MPSLFIMLFALFVSICKMCDVFKYIYSCGALISSFVALNPFNYFQTFLFAISGEALTQRLRAKIFRLLLRQEVAYFDKSENSTGALCTRLSTEASAVQGVSVSKLEIDFICFIFKLTNNEFVFRLPVFGLELCYRIFPISVWALFWHFTTVGN